MRRRLLLALVLVTCTGGLLLGADPPKNDTTPSPVTAQPPTETRVPKITDLLTAEETKRAGLSKLTPDEISALNGALLRVLVELTTRVQKPEASPTRSAAVSDDLALYDARGRAVAYFAADHDLAIYLWSGEPVAYLDDDSVYGFNGKHLGWLRNGAVYDHDSNVVAAQADKFQSPVEPAPPKALKQLRPLKGLKELKPLKPLFGITWSGTPAKLFFLQGVE